MSNPELLKSDGKTLFSLFWIHLEFFFHEREKKKCTGNCKQLFLHASLLIVRDNCECISVTSQLIVKGTRIICFHDMS